MKLYNLNGFRHRNRFRHRKICSTLDGVRAGDRIKIISIKDPLIRAQAVRLGISEGAVMRCSRRIPGGPVVLKNSFQEIAVGIPVARSIEVSFEE